MRETAAPGARVSGRVERREEEKEGKDAAELTLASTPRSTTGPKPSERALRLPSPSSRLLLRPARQAAAAETDVHERQPAAALLGHACIAALRPALDADHSCGFLRMVRLSRQGLRTRTRRARKRATRRAAPTALAPPCALVVAVFPPWAAADSVPAAPPHRARVPRHRRQASRARAPFFGAQAGRMGRSGSPSSSTTAFRCSAWRSTGRCRRPKPRKSIKPGKQRCVHMPHRTHAHNHAHNHARARARASCTHRPPVQRAIGRRRAHGGVAGVRSDRRAQSAER